MKTTLIDNSLRLESESADDSYRLGIIFGKIAKKYGDPFSLPKTEFTGPGSTTVPVTLLLDLLVDSDVVMIASEQARNALKAAESALRSYQFNNSSPDLAKEVADKISDLLRRMAFP